MDAWPFLIARAPIAEYQVVMAPGPTIKAGRHEMLGLAATGSEQRPGTVVVRDVDGDLGLRQPCSIAYRVSLPTAGEYGLDGAERVVDATDVLRDASGRPIRITEGFVFATSAQQVMDRGLDEANLRQLRSSLTDGYRHFWPARSRQPALPSNKLDLAPVSPRERIPLRVVEPYPLRVEPYVRAAAPTRSGDIGELRPGVPEQSLRVPPPLPKLGTAAVALLAAFSLLWLVLADTGRRPHADITKPDRQESVGASLRVEGTSRNMRPGDLIWIVIVAPDKTHHLDREPARVEDDGRWAASIDLGNDDGATAGRTFKLIAVSAGTKKKSAVLRNWPEQSRVDSLPKGLSKLDQVVVVRP